MSQNKSLFLFSMLILFVCSSFARDRNRSAHELRTKKCLEYSKRSLPKESPGDTLIFYGTDPTIYLVDGDSGFVAGTNLWGDLAKWQRFDVGQESTLKSFSLYFGTYKIVDPADQIQVTVRAGSGTGPMNAPGDILYSEDITLDEMDTTAKNTFSLDGENVEVPASFFVGVEWEVMDDSFSLVLDKENLGDSASRAWEKWSDGTFGSFLAGWGLDTDLWIDATVSYTIEVKDKVHQQRPFALKQNYPNPFHTNTNIEFQISIESDVVVDIFNSRGERIKQLCRETLLPDKYHFTWNGADESGSIVSSGVYYIVLINEINGVKSQVKKEMFFLK